ncbi:HesA/MoeB/ThiF family protein, partial [Clostridium perfringens]
NVVALVADADAVLDGCDNFATRLLVADACLAGRIPLISAAIGQFDGQLATFRGWEADKPCYRCFVGEDPERAGVSCAEDGVLGPMAG